MMVGTTTSLELGVCVSMELCTDYVIVMVFVDTGAFVLDWTGGPQCLPSPVGTVSRADLRALLEVSAWLPAEATYPLPLAVVGLQTALPKHAAGESSALYLWSSGEARSIAPWRNMKFICTGAHPFRSRVA